MKKTDPSTWENLPENIRRALINNELASLKPEERIILYVGICAAKGLDAATRPFEFIQLNGKLTLYARKECADQLRERNGVNAEIVSAKAEGDVYCVHIRAKTADGRTEDDIGVTSISEPEFLTRKDKSKYANPRYGKKMEGEDIANAMMKAVTKGKRRCTLSICGLGMFDESEIEGIADAAKGKAPSLEEVKAIAARVVQLRDDYAKALKTDRPAIMAQITELEASILDLPGSGGTPEEQPKAEAKAEPIPPAAEKPAPAPEKPAPVVEAPKPAKEKPAPAKEAEKPAPVVEKPAAESAPAAGGWRDYVVTIIPHKDFKGGKRLGDIAPKTIEIIKINWVDKFPDEIAKNETKINDAAAIRAAYAELFPAK